MKIKSKFKFKERVVHKLGDEEMFVDAIAIYSSRSISYGCATRTGDVKWFRDYELESIRTDKPLGFNIEINEKTRPTKNKR